MLIRPARPPIVAPFARPIGEDGSGLGWDAGVGGGPQILNLADLSLGTFTRSTEGSYLTGAPTDGSSAFLAWAGVNVRRIENRGDGLGSMLLMEGSRTNYVVRSRDQTVYWSPDAGSFTAGQPSPDGAAAAYRHQVPSGNLGNYQLTVGITGAYFTHTQWLRAFSGSVTGRMSSWEGATGTANTGIVGTIDTTYRRWEIGAAMAANIWVSPSSGRLLVLPGGAAGAANQIVDLIQVEPGRAPSSPIRTLGATVTRGADVLQYASGTYPTSLLSRGFSITFAPDFSSAEAAAGGTTQVLVYAGTNNVLWLIGNAGVCRAELWCNGVRVINTTVTFSRGQLLTLSASPSLGGVSALTIAGASSGNGTATGTASAWGAGVTLYVGSDNSGLQGAFGRFGTSMVML